MTPSSHPARGSSRLGAILALAASLAGGGRAAALPPSTFTEVVLQPGDRRVTVAVPAGYTGDEPVPLVVALHFAGTVTPFYGRYVLTGLFEPALRGLGAVMVAPDCPGASWSEPASEDAVMAALEWARGAFRIDPARTLLAGYSMGARGAWALAARHQDRFRAALVVSGHPPAGAAEVDWRIPIYVIHSRDDERLLLKPTADAVALLRARGADVRLEVIDGPTHYQVERFAPHVRAAIPWLKRAWRR